MQAVIETVAPIFGLIALGFGIARVGYLPESTGKGLADFVFNVAIPALLFRLMLQETAAPAAPYMLWACFLCVMAATWLAASVLTRMLLKRPATDGASIAMASTYGNIILLGIPLAIDRFGAEAATPAALIVSVYSPTLWLAATLHMEWAGKSSGLDVVSLLRELASNLLRNPVIVALIAGLAWRQTGLGLHPLIDKTVALLGQAAVPGALVALGLSLSGFAIRGQTLTVTVILTLSLIFMPAVAWVLAFDIFQLPPVWAGVVVLLAAAPPGVNCFLFASRYEAAVGSVSSAVALGTALCALTVSAIILLMDGITP